MQTYNFFTMTQEPLMYKNLDYLLVRDAQGEFSSLSQLLQNETHFFSPLLITNAVANLCPFSETSFVKPNASAMSARDIFLEGMAFGRAYELRGNALILAQHSQGAYENALHTLEKLQNNKDKSHFDALASCDATLLFCGGFLLEASRRFHVIVGGDLEMAFVLKMVDILREELLMRPMSANITYLSRADKAQTQELTKLLQELSYAPHALYTSLDLQNAEVQELHGIATLKESAAASAALAYAQANAITDEAIIKEMELLHYLR